MSGNPTNEDFAIIGDGREKAQRLLGGPASICQCRPHGFDLWFGLTLIILGLLLTGRRFGFKCYLVLDKDALFLPTGFGRLHTTRIPYASIERVWEATLFFGTTILSVATDEGKFEIVRTMLPDTGSYVEVHTFLYTHSRANS
jgi:hypothetical protein